MVVPWRAVGAREAAADGRRDRGAVVVEVLHQPLVRDVAERHRLVAHQAPVLQVLVIPITHHRRQHAPASRHGGLIILIPAALSRMLHPAST